MVPGCQNQGRVRKASCPNHSKNAQKIGILPGVPEEDETMESLALFELEDGGSCGQGLKHVKNMRITNRFVDPVLLGCYKGTNFPYNFRVMRLGQKEVLLCIGSGLLMGFITVQIQINWTC